MTQYNQEIHMGNTLMLSDCKSYIQKTLSFTKWRDFPDVIFHITSKSLHRCKLIGCRVCKKLSDLTDLTRVHVVVTVRPLIKGVLHLTRTHYKNYYNQKRRHLGSEHDEAVGQDTTPVVIGSTTVVTGFYYRHDGRTGRFTGLGNIRKAGIACVEEKWRTKKFSR